jgi:hypothetical protein
VILQGPHSAVKRTRFRNRTWRPGRAEKWKWPSGISGRPFPQGE